ncbi:methyl-accepting chemotaxis sensory transducer with phytochrome sensor [Richelia sinica FACHB-800]|uniref:Methyl-accepting chemotaxis sensory transducer with phytochrome sensor n=1 Tax=Richelia sinica FACHB-800 TaxID=1357546 RepID=A0A975Y3D7_9NOST|nr:methyl-accepting chemotaxis protein [Richelia sinica]MBD2663162.1 GAF domain-containing protein [Richelia sinica FACHB-800]QXE22036.1 methyl-accepting chemotaxis sensory transducer with phytochrome sensor [Richelia sinica FACHB-800]
MINKTNHVQGGDAQNQSPKILNSPVNESTADVVKNSDKVNFNYHLHQVFKYLQRFNLSKRTVITSMIMGAVPVLVIGAIAYNLGSKSISRQIIQSQEIEATNFANQVNKLILARYGDIQILSQLPYLTNTKGKTGVSIPDQQGTIDSFVKANQAYDSIAVFDLQGKVIIQSTGLFLNQEENKKYFTQVVQQDQVIISSPELVNNNLVIYIAAPVKDAGSGKTVAIVRARMPLSWLAETIDNHQADKNKYYLVDSQGTFLVAPQSDILGKKAEDIYPNLWRLNSQKSGTAFTAVKKFNQQPELVSFLPVRNLDGIPNLNWQVMVAQDSQLAFAPQRNFFLLMVIVTLLSALLAGFLVALVAKSNTKVIIKKPISTAPEINTFKDKTTDGKLPEDYPEKDLEGQWLKSLLDIHQKLRNQVLVEDIYQTAVTAIRPALQTDRVIIYLLNPQIGMGKVVAESVFGDWEKMVDMQIEDRYFRELDAATYQDTQVQAIANIHQEANLSQNYIQWWERFAVKSSLIAPIITQGQPMGLLITHHCRTAHDWQAAEINFFAQTAHQISAALEQAQLRAEIATARSNQPLTTIPSSSSSETLQLQLLKDSLQNIVTQVKQTAGQVNAVFNWSELSPTEINTTLQAVENMTNSIQVLAELAGQTVAVTNNVAQTATQGGQAIDITFQNILSLQETVGETSKKVRKLGEFCQQISRVITDINQIAMQTNLLAINAGIEAARAGEEGQGFAVVAEEVGELAARSSAATQEIEQIVEKIQAETSAVIQVMVEGNNQVIESTRLVENSKEILHHIFDVSRQIDSLLQLISTATDSQVETSQMISQFITNIAVVSQRTNHSSQQVCQSLQTTMEISQQLQETVETLTSS